MKIHIFVFNIPFLNINQQCQFFHKFSYLPKPVIFKLIIGWFGSRRIALWDILFADKQNLNVYMGIRIIWAFR